MRPCLHFKGCQRRREALLQDAHVPNPIPNLVLTTSESPKKAMEWHDTIALTARVHATLWCHIMKKGADFRERGGGRGTESERGRMRACMSIDGMRACVCVHACM